MHWDWFDTSEATHWALQAVWSLSALSVILTLCGLWVWHRGTERHRRRLASLSRWQPLVLEYVYAATEDRRSQAADRLRTAIRPSERHDFAEFVLVYLRDLRGAEADSLRALLRSLGLLERARAELRARSSWRRASAAQLLEGMRAPESIPDLVRAVHDTSPLVSYVAAFALERIGGEQARIAVADALAQRSDWNPSQIKEIFLRGGPEFTDRLVALLDQCDPNAEKTKVLVDLLGILRHTAAAGALLALLERGAPAELRVSILRSLGRLSYAPALPKILQAAREARWVVRSQAMLALGRIGDPSSVPVLAAGLDDDQYWVRFNAALALRSFGTAGRSVLAGVAQRSHVSTAIAREVLLEEAA